MFLFYILAIFCFIAMLSGYYENQRKNLGSALNALFKILSGANIFLFILVVFLSYGGFLQKHKWIIFPSVFLSFFGAILGLIARKSFYGSILRNNITYCIAGIISAIIFNFVGSDVSSMVERVSCLPAAMFSQFIWFCTFLGSLVFAVLLLQFIFLAEAISQYVIENAFSNIDKN